MGSAKRCPDDNAARFPAAQISWLESGAPQCMPRFRAQVSRVRVKLELGVALIPAINIKLRT